MPFSLPRTPHLLTQGTVAALLSSVQLKCLTQQGVERLARAVDGGRVGRHGEGSHVAHLLQGTVALGGLVQQLVVLQVLRQALQHGNGLVEVHLQKAHSASFVHSWKLIPKQRHRGCCSLQGHTPLFFPPFPLPEITMLVLTPLCYPAPEQVTVINRVYGKEKHQLLQLRTRFSLLCNPQSDGPRYWLVSVFNLKE